MALYSRVHTWVTNEVLTASDLNAEYDNILTNAKASSVVGYSANASEMQTVTDPGSVGSESLAGAVSEELARIRYMLKFLSGQAQWYVHTGRSLATSSLAILAGDISSDAVTTAKILDGNVTNAKIADTTITGGKLANGTIGTTQLSDGSVTAAKLAALNSGITADSGTFNCTTTGDTLIWTALSFTVTASRPVLIMMVPSNGGASVISMAGTATAAGELRIYRDSTEIGANKLPCTSGVTDYYPPVLMYDAPGNGTYSYSIKANTFGNGTINVQYWKLLVYQL